MSRPTLSIRPEFGSRTRIIEASKGFYGGCEQGRRIPFDGDPAIQFPVIGNVYLVRDFSSKENGSTARPMILIGYYVHNGKPVALDFLKPTSQMKENRADYDTDRYDIVLNQHGFSDFKPVDKKISCDTITTLPNNKSEVLRPLPIDKIECPLLADYFLRRALVLYEQKARWKKDAAIPAGAIRHGFLINGLEQSQCAIADRFVPDLMHSEQTFTHQLHGPKFIAERMSEIMDWALKAHMIRKATGIKIELPALKTFPNWPNPTDFLKSRSAQMDYMQALQCS